MPNKLRKYLSWIGPYPYNSWLIFSFFTLLYFSRFVPGISQQSDSDARWIAAVTILAMAAVPSGIFALLAFLFQKYRFWPLNLISYILEISLGQALLLFFSPIMAQVLQSQIGLEYTAPVTLTPTLFLSALVLVLIIFASMHNGERAILNRLKLADNLVSKLEDDRAGLVRADEELRQQTSTFLHDRVQSDLMVASMKLKAIAGKSSIEVNEVIERVIHGLEQTRKGRLKDLVQILAPNFEAASFRDSVQVLAELSQTRTQIVINVDEASEKLEVEKLLGAFRIVEQSLLNALVHGPAKNVRVSLTTNSNGRSNLEVSDDGPGSDMDSVRSGVGTAVIDSWVSILHGVKTINTASGHGYRLSVEFASSAF